MSTLTGRIEQYIKDLLAAADRPYVEVKRNELAQSFACVPSQINYVLETRFRNDQGYHVISHRGAGGCFQIIRLEVTNDDELQELIAALDGSHMDSRSAESLLSRLYDEDFLSRHEAMLLQAVVSHNALGAAGERENDIRAEIMKNILVTLLRADY